MESNLKIYTLVDGVNTPFPDADSQVEIFDYTYTAKRMGGAPSIAATIQYATCLDDVWTENVFLEFKGEKYFLKQTPTSSLSNDNARYKHEAEFVSERIILDNVYFYDVVDANILTDKPVSNSSKVAFFGTIEEFVSRLNESLRYAKLQTADSLGNYLSGYRVVIDEGITSEGKLITFEDQFFSNVLQEIYKVYELPYYFDGKTIHIGFEYSTLTQTFEYGIENELLSVTKTNANNKIVNRATGQGSSDNVPYYYPNMSEKGDIEPEYYTVDNNKVEVSGLRVVNAEKYANKISTGESLTYTVEDVICTYYPNGWQYVLGTGRSTTYSENKPIQYRYLNRNSKLEISFSRKIEIGGNGFIKLPSTMTVWYDEYGTGGYTHSILDPKYIQNIRLEQRNGDVTTTHEMELYKSSTGQYAGFTNTNKLQVGYGKKADMWLCYDLILPTSAIQLKDNGTQDVRVQHTMKDNVAEEYIYWLSEHNKTEYPNLGAVGIGLPSTYTPAGGDKIIQKLIKYVQPQETLMPSIYRETGGEERFYNAVNGEYKDEDNNDVIFPNPYVEGKPKEQIVSFDDIKPTIVGMTNENGQRIDQILAVAFDRNDNNETEEIDGTLHYKHPYFFVKLPKFDGPNAFNLFDNKIDESEMTLSMTSGECGGCEFTIMVSDDDLQANTVQVDNNGDLLYDDNGNVICGREKYQSAVTPQDRQNDTINNEVWIALKKDEQTFGTMLPTMAISPAIGDTFVFLHINLPQAYIEAAEDRLEKAIIEYIRDNNEEKFTFSIKFSRIFLAENPNIESQINENALLHIVYNGYTYPLYVSSYSYKVNSGDALPEITVELADKLAVSQNAIQTAISEVKGDFLESFNNIDFLGLGRSYFMRKDVDDRSAGKIAASLGFEAGGYNKGISGAIIDEIGNAEFGALKVRDKIEAEIITTPNFVQGLVGGSGGRLWVDENGNANLEVDNIIARQSLSVMQLSIKEVDSVGGMLVVSSSNGEIVGVAESDDATQYYIELAEGQMFKAGDLIRCSAWDATNNVLKSYWVEFHPTDENENSVSSSSVGWVSKSEFNDNIIPSVGDKLVQMGNTTDTLRQGVIVITSVDNKPNISIYDGVNSASFDGKLTTRLGDLSGVSFNGKDLSGYGLWSGNAYLRGELMVSSGKSVEDEIKSQISKSLDRNYARLTATPVEINQITSMVNATKFIYSVTGLQKGDEVTVSFDWEMLDVVPDTDSSFINIQFDDVYGYYGTGFRLNIDQIGSGSGHHTATVTIQGRWDANTQTSTGEVKPTDVSRLYIRFDNITIDGGSYFKISNLRVNKGNVAHAWQPAPEDNLTELKTSYEGYVEATNQNFLSVQQSITTTNNVVANNINSGRNLLLGTNKGTESWSLSSSLNKPTNYNIIETIYNDVKGVKFVKLQFDIYAQREIFFFPLRPEYIIKGKTYTLSFDAKFSNIETSKTRLGAIIASPTGESMLTNYHAVSITEDSSWQHYEINILAKESGVIGGSQVVYLYIVEPSTTFWEEISFANLKLEQSTIATPWSPAPEDAEESIKASEQVFKSEIKQTADAISLKVKETEYFTTSNLIVGSYNKFENKDYLLATYNLADVKPNHGDTVTLSFSGKIEDIQGSFAIFNSGWDVYLTRIYATNYNEETQRYEATFIWQTESEYGVTAPNTDIRIFQGANAGAVGSFEKPSIIYDVMLTRTDKAVAYKPTPTDVEDKLKDTGIDIESKKITVTADNFQVQNNEGDTTLAVDEKGNLVTNTLQAMSTNQFPLIAANVNNSGVLVFYYPHKNGQRQMEMGWDAQSQSLMRYYDENDNMLWKIGNEKAFIEPDYTEWTTLSLYKVKDGGTDSANKEDAKTMAKSQLTFDMSYYYQHNNVGSNNVVYVQKDIYSEKINGWFTPHASPQPFDTEMSGLVYRSLRHYTNGIPDYYVPDNEMTFPIN